jgi:excisionase family DNA binding protein
MSIRYEEIEEKSIFLTTSQAAELLNISNATLKKFITLGRIKTFRTPGGHYRIRKHDLLKDLLYSAAKTEGE